MPQSVTLKIRGLYTSDNDLGAVPEGALLKATDIVIDKTDIAEPRRGFDRLSAGFSADATRSRRLWFYQDKLFAHLGTDKVAYWDGAAWQELSGSYAAPTMSKVYTAEANQNLYFATSTGVKKLDAYNAAVKAAGGVKGLDLQASSSASTPLWLSASFRTAYRAVWGYKDANNNLVLGAPSAREEYTNTTATAVSVSLSVTIPNGVTTAWFVQLYRASAVDNSASEVAPSDEMQLVYEANPTSGEISAGTMTISDVTPDDLRGASLYTNASQEGLVNGNEQPPLAKDLAVYKGHTFYANTTSKHRYYLTLLAVDTTNGLAIDDTVTVGGITYTAKAAETAASAQFRAYKTQTFTFVDADVSTGADTITKAAHGLQNGDPVRFTNTGGSLPGGLSAGVTYFVRDSATNTFKVAASVGAAAVDITSAAGGGTHTLTIQRSASQRIRDTALSICRVVNRYSSSTVYAYYLSGPTDLPGKILFEERAIGGSSFAVTSSRATAWSPDLPTSGTAESSTNDTFKNGLFFSKPLQPEAVPLPNFFAVGSKDEDIKRIIPLRDSLFLFKDDGIYRVTGENAASFNVTLLDSSAKLLAPDTCAVLNNQIYAFTDQGVVTISETGVSVISRAIEQELLALISASLANVRDYSFGVSYESERKYLLWTITSSGDTYATQAYVWNTFTSTWVKWDLAKRCGAVSPADDKLYLGEADSNYVNQERKTRTFTDQVDFGFTTALSAVTATTCTVTSGADNIVEGDIVYQSASVFSIVDSVDTLTGIVTLKFNGGLTVAAATIYKAIATEIEWVPVTFGNPAAIKQLHTAIYLFKSDFTGEGTATFKSDLSPSEDTVTFAGAGLTAWGLFDWGAIPWGGEPQKRPIRTWIPRNKNVCSQLTAGFRHATGFAAWQLTGISIVGEVGGERVSR